MGREEDDDEPDEMHAKVPAKREKQKSEKHRMTSRDARVNRACGWAYVCEGGMMGQNVDSREKWTGRTEGEREEGTKGRMGG